jgi:hypothetical protein
MWVVTVVCAMERYRSGADNGANRSNDAFAEDILPPLLQYTGDGLTGA